MRDAENHYNLIYASLEDKPSYEILSYVWDDARNKRDILINEYIFSVTVNLEIALRNLRKPNEMRTLWINILYIN
jgi:hypothetical protein